MIDFLRNHSMLQIVHKIQTRALSSTELVESLLEQIDRTDERVQAYVTVCRKTARKQANVADGLAARNGTLGPLHGIPVSLKDIFDTRGIKTTFGHSLTLNNVPNRDCVVVAKLKAAGAIILGKLHTHELAMGVRTPPTRNPWNLEHIPGGSSGGSGAAIAVGSALVAMGSDTGGSIRIPASLCGVVGLKPTYGSISNEGVLPQSWSLDHVGPITRRVADAEFIFSILKSERNSRGLICKDRNLGSTKGGSKKRKLHLRIGIPKNYFFDECDPDVRKTVELAIDLLKGLDYKIVEFEFPMMREILASYLTIVSCESTANHQRTLFEAPESFGEDVRLFVERGLYIPATYYIQALRFRKEAAMKVSNLFRGFEAIITPTEPVVAPRIDARATRTSGSKYEDIVHALIRYVCPFNYLGLPALSIPCGFSKGGLPIGMQIITNFDCEKTAFEVGNAYESETNWHLKAPSLAS